MVMALTKCISTFLLMHKQEKIYVMAPKRGKLIINPLSAIESAQKTLKLKYETKINIILANELLVMFKEGLFEIIKAKVKIAVITFAKDRYSPKNADKM